MGNVVFADLPAWCEPDTPDSKRAHYFEADCGYHFFKAICNREFDGCLLPADPYYSQRCRDCVNIVYRDMLGVK